MSDGMFSIRGKKILFLAPAFFSYELKIQAKMEEMGAIVDYYDARSVKSAMERALLKLSPNLFKTKTQKYYDEILKSNKDKNYDYVFIIKCDMITSSILETMKETFKNAKFCLYLWDSVNNIPGVESKFKYFDRILSFDRSDANRHRKILFRPLFYLDEFKKDTNPDHSTANEIDHSTANEIDLCFLGTIHSDRYAIIKEIKRACEDSGLVFFSFQYLQSKFIYYVYKLFKKEFRDTRQHDFSFEKMNTKDISNIVDKSKIILDIEHPKQTGLTMRTIEMIGMQKKIITTNTDIVHYDFYDPQNILVISRDNPKIPQDFFYSEYSPLDNNIYNRYYVETWIKDAFFGI